MKEQPFDTTCLEALDAANADLERLFAEEKRLRNRMEQIDSVINALKPLMSDSDALAELPELPPPLPQVDATLGLVLV